MIDQNIISDLKGFDGLEPYGHQRWIPTFKGWHQVLQRQVVVRLFFASEEVMNSIRRSVLLETMADQVVRFHHPGIIKWFKLEKVSLQNAGYYCLINEWFSDESLNEWLSRYGALNEESVLLTAEHVVTSLTHYWNSCHIAHGNLKPQNILIDKEGNLKIDKFGLTTLLAMSALKGAKGIIGTPAFMAPELSAGCATPNDLSDIYALGMTMSCLLTGLREPEQNKNHTQPNMPIRMPLSLEMGEIIRHMTAVRPKDRLPSWEAVRAAINQYEQSHAIKSDHNKKTQTINIPVCKNHTTKIFEAVNSPNIPRGIKVDEVSKISTNIIPVATIKRTPRVKVPIANSTVKADDKQIVRHISKLWVMAAALFLVLIVVIAMWYLRSTKGVATTDSNKVVLVTKDKTNALPSKVASLLPANQQLPMLQTNGLAIVPSRAINNKKDGVPEKDDEAQAQLEPAPSSSPLDILSQQVVPDKAYIAIPVRPAPINTAIAESASVDAPEGKTQDPKLAALTKRAETGDGLALYEVGEYYASINDNTNACEWYQRAAERNLPRALCKYGDCLMTGKGTEKDEIAAIEEYKKAAEKSDATGQYKLADCYVKGEHVPQNLKMAIQLLKSAASNDHAESSCYLGDCALEGIGINKNPKQAVVYYKKAADLNYSPAYCRLADVYSEGLLGKTNHVMALEMYVKAAEMNNIKAQGKLVTHYLSKKTITVQDGAKINRWLKAAVTNTFDDASEDDKKTLTGLYVIYGDCLMDGIFMRKDSYEAVVWYEKAAKVDDPNALYKYGLCLLNGKGVQQNENEAFSLFMRATGKNDAQGAWMVGECYLNGKGVNQDTTQAIKWLVKATNQKVPEAQYRMGECCLNGIGVAASAEDAFLWFLKSAEAGYEPAIAKVVECYQKGVGAKKSMQNATLWHNKQTKKPNQKIISTEPLPR